MADAVTLLISLTLILLGGIIAIGISKKTKLPLALTLFAVGAIFANIIYYGRPVISFPGFMLAAFSIIAVIIAIFDSTSKIRFSNFDKTSKDVFSFFFLNLLLNVFLITYLTMLLFKLQWFIALFFSLMVSCVEYYTIFPKHHVPKNKILQFLKEESDISCAFVLIIPFLIITFMQTVAPYGTAARTIISFSVNVFGGIGIGVIVSIILFKLLSYRRFEWMSPLVSAAAILVAYLAALKIDGNGLVAVAVMGFIFANVFIKNRQVLRSKLFKIDSIVEILLLLVIGSVIQIPFTWEFLRLSVGLFLFYLLLRLISASLALWHYSSAERVEIALFVPKGFATVAIAFALLNFSFVGMLELIQLLMAFFVYSLIFDYVLDRMNFYKSR
ncbi:hypothetical protein JXB27_00985 [Candidatus Woesearchaeota archaeon]|nr:hypothetical protein [Candidatus Woesearchaeota archaeon]